MDKKIFEMSVLMSETDERIYYDVTLQDIATTDNLLQIIKSIQDIHNLLFEKYLGKIGIDIIDRNTNP